jgi:hypothetical protein
MLDYYLAPSSLDIDLVVATVGPPSLRRNIEMPGAASL